jgi:type IV pilus assembly protein PilQ
MGGGKMKMMLRIFCMAGLFMVFFLQIAWASVSLDIRNGDLREVLFSLADLGGKNIVLDDSVQGKISVKLDDVEVEEALNLISRIKDLTCEERMGAFIVANKQRMDKNFSEMHSFPIHFADSEALEKTLDLMFDEAGISEKKTNNKSDTKVNGTKDLVGKDEGLLPETPKKGKRFYFNQAASQLFFYGTEAETALVDKVIKAMDVPEKQVSLEARVVAIQKEAAKKFGVEWQWSKLPQYPEYSTTYESVKHSVENADGSHTTVTEDIPKTTVQRSWQNAGTVPGVLQFGHGPEGHPFEFYYAAELSALVNEGRATVLARPNIMTIQGREAVINIGGEVPVPKTSTTNATTTTSIEYREAGIILRYTPRVNDDGYITATVHTGVSSPLYVEELKAYRFQKRSADTTVRLKDGETMVIGGLIGSEEAKSLSKVPFLGDLPILGQFFRSERNSKTESEIMIFLTARVVP